MSPGSPKFLLKYNRAPGDELVLTALVRDLYQHFHGAVEIQVTSKHGNLWENNPYLTPGLKAGSQVKTVPLAEQPTIREIQRGKVLHYVGVFHQSFHSVTRLKIPVTAPKPDLHLSQDERDNPLISGRYWVIVPGGKSDMTNKIWEHERYQQVVDWLKWYGLNFVQEGSRKKGCIHPRLDGVLDLVGRTNIRQMIRNIYHAEGVICGVSLPMHIAGALDRPCIVIGGGRESPCFEEYSNAWPGAFGDRAGPVKVPHRFLHTVGLLDCCRTRGCWLRRVEALGDGRRSQGQMMDSSLCKRPLLRPNQKVPLCLDMLQTEHVVEAVMSYYSEGLLPPL